MSRIDYCSNVSILSWKIELVCWLKSLKPLEENSYLLIWKRNLKVYASSMPLGEGNPAGVEACMFFFEMLWILIKLIKFGPAQVITCQKKKKRHFNFFPWKKFKRRPCISPVIDSMKYRRMGFLKNMLTVWLNRKLQITKQQYVDLTVYEIINLLIILIYTYIQNSA